MIFKLMNVYPCEYAKEILRLHDQVSYTLSTLPLFMIKDWRPFPKKKEKIFFL